MMHDGRGHLQVDERITVVAEIGQHAEHWDGHIIVMDAWGLRVRLLGSDIDVVMPWESILYIKSQWRRESKCIERLYGPYPVSKFDA